MAGLSFTETLDLIFRLFVIVPLTAITYLVRAAPLAWRSRPIPTRYFIQTAVFRVLLHALLPHHIQAIAPPTIKAYELWIQGKRRELSSTTSPPSSRDAAMLECLKSRIDALWVGNDNHRHRHHEGSVMWLGDPETATRFVLFFHGGGFVIPMNKGHVEWCYQTYILPSSARGASSVKEARPDVAVAILEYALAPTDTYPTQLIQACRSLEHVLAHIGRRGIDPATSLIMGGDSAGGNLSALVIRHLLSPHPGIDPISTSSTAGVTLAGVFLVSPFLDDRTATAASYRDNGDFDMISEPWLKAAVETMLKPRKDFPSLTVADLTRLACPLQGDMSSWLPRADTVVRSMYITAGGLESFRDHIVQFADHVRKQCPGLQLKFDLIKKEVHDQILVEATSMHFGDAMRRMEDWTVETLKLGQD